MPIGLSYLLGFTIRNLGQNYVLNGEWDEKKYNEYLWARSVLPLYKEYSDYLIAKRKNEWYMEQYGLEWPDVEQPWNLPGTRTMEASITGALNYVSDNIKRLYK